MMGTHPSAPRTPQQTTALPGWGSTPWPSSPRLASETRASGSAGPCCCCCQTGQPHRSPLRGSSGCRPSHLQDEALLNLKPDPNPKPDPQPKPEPERQQRPQQQHHHHQQQQHRRHHPTQPQNSQKVRRQQKRHHPDPNSNRNPSQDPPPAASRVPLPPARAATTEAATQNDPVQTLVDIPISKRPIIHLP